MDEKLTWKNMMDKIDYYFSTCPDNEFLHYYNEIFDTSIEVSDININRKE